MTRPNVTRPREDRSEELVGTCLVFGVVGFIAGRHIERVHLAEQFYHRLAEHDELTGLDNWRAQRGTAIREATFDALFDAADQALYEGKKNGRNRLQSNVIAV